LPFFYFFCDFTRNLQVCSFTKKREKRKKMKGASTWATAQSNPLAQKAHVADYSLAAGSPT
jgi:hypothetical protein